MLLYFETEIILSPDVNSWGDLLASESDAAFVRSAYGDAPSMARLGRSTN